MDATDTLTASVSVTERAARHIRNALARRGKGVGLRLGVKTSGCSGLAYAIEFADEARADDLRFDCHGVQLLVDPKSLLVLAGTELDFVREGLNEGFKFHNPNARNTCGCGESFTV
jgi:iron-sulfur cluster assembly protein